MKFDLTAKTLADAQAADLFSGTSAKSDDATVLEVAESLRGATIGQRIMLSLADDLDGMYPKSAKTLLNRAIAHVDGLALQFLDDSVVIAKGYATPVVADAEGNITAKARPTHIAFQVVKKTERVPMTKCETAECQRKVKTPGMCADHKLPTPTPATVPAKETAKASK